LELAGRRKQNSRWPLPKKAWAARGVDYSRLTALLIEATKEQQALIRRQQKVIRAQQAQISQLASQVQTIQVSLSSGRQASFEVSTASVRTPPRP